MPECVFCRIIAGDEAASLVYRDELCVAFMDIQPVNPGHLLIVPLTHAAQLAELDVASAERLMSVAQRLGLALRQSSLRCEGVNLLLADGEAAGQDVFHVHLHAVPRFAGDGFGFRFSPGYHQRPPRADLDQAAALIRAALPTAEA